MRHFLVALSVICVCTASVRAQSSFVNWETPQVYPLALTPDGTRLVAANTPDNRIEVFEVSGKGITHLGAVAVGLDPVTVRARTNTEIWVVNHISDSISIVDLRTMNVVQTITTGDEPADVVFAGDPQRAFVTISQLNQIEVYDPGDLSLPPIVLDIEGEDPRALATDGATVYAAIFESGNHTTILGEMVVSSSVNPYPGDENPPPNDGTEFNPPIAGDLPTPPEVSIIVQKSEAGVWLDDNGADWSAAVGWDLHDHDVAVIDADSLEVSYITGLMNTDMGIAVSPLGSVTVVGTEATNVIRFEPNIAGTFVRVMGALLPAGGGSPVLVDLNPHLDYSGPTVSQELRDQSLGDPRGIVWNADGTQGYITGMGSNNVAVVDADLNRAGLVEVGQGPTGIVLDDVNGRLYVLNRFDDSVSTIDQATLEEALPRAVFYDPTPEAIRAGRPFLYDTHRTSGLGQTACASCHVDGRTDQIAWDLGNPVGEVQDFNQNCNGGIPGGGFCEDWHPMKGPMTTQTLIGISGTEPFHWRGDRAGLSAFNPAFESLMGDDAQLTDEEMDQFIAFIDSLTPPPNPFRNFDNSLPTTFPNGGDPNNGRSLYMSLPLDGGLLTCGACHQLPTGTNGIIISGNLLNESQSMKIPQLRNMHEKTGFDATSMNNNSGFGFIHDGSVDTLFNFLTAPVFTFLPGESGNQQRRDIVAFMMCFATDTNAAVGVQTTVVDAAQAPAEQVELIDDMISRADAFQVGLIVKGVQDGEQRGYEYIGGGEFQSDRAAEILTAADLFAGAVPGSELTYTVVPRPADRRMGIDRDEDGVFDGDEIDAGTDPADPDDFPLDPCAADLSGDGIIESFDLALLLGSWGSCDGCPADIDGDGSVNAFDLALLLGTWGPCE